MPILVHASSKLRFGRVEAFKQARPSLAAKSRSMLGLQATAPGFARKSPGVGSVFPPRCLTGRLLYKRCACSPGSHLTRLVAMSSVHSRLADLKALQSSGFMIITDEQYTTHCDRILSALHGRPPETPPRSNAVNAANAADQQPFQKPEIDGQFHDLLGP